MSDILQDKVAIVTGGSRGIGLAIATTFAAAGARVMVTSRTEHDLRQAASGMDGDVAWFATDVGDPAAAEACVAATMDRFGSVDILVNNAATNPYRGPLMGIDVPVAEQTLRVNVIAPLVWTQCAWRASMEQRGGSVINISSITGFTQGTTALAWYAMSKAALIHLTKSLAREMGPTVRVNTICPGIIKTDMSRAFWEQHEAATSATYPLRRLGLAQDIAAAALFLASDGASWTTGATLVVDGGATLGTA